jgi:hypothetical protein
MLPIPGCEPKIRSNRQVWTYARVMPHFSEMSSQVPATRAHHIERSPISRARRYAR